MALKPFFKLLSKFSQHPLNKTQCRSTNINNFPYISVNTCHFFSLLQFANPPQDFQYLKSNSICQRTLIRIKASSKLNNSFGIFVTKIVHFANSQLLALIGRCFFLLLVLVDFFVFSKLIPVPLLRSISP